jgi:hypothetical protein
MDSPEQECHAVAFFDDVLQAFVGVAATRGLVERSYRIGGGRLQLRFAGPSLVSTISAALAHRLTVESQSPPDLTVCVWDSASTGCQMPRAALREQTIRGEIGSVNTSRIYAVCERGYPGITLFDRVRRLALYWVPDLAALPEWVAGAPLRLLFHWWMGLRGGQLVHGAAVGTTDGAVLISARGGSGKSTSALACLAGGMRYAGDDYVLLTLTPSPRVSNVYATAKLAAHQLEHFPWLRKVVANPGALDREKALIFLDRDYAGQLTDSLPLRAVLVPHVTGLPDTKLKPTSAASALKAIAPSTLLFHPRGGDQELRTLGQLVRAVPTYVLECGTDLAQIPATISALLQDLTRDAAARR